MTLLWKIKGVILAVCFASNAQSLWLGYKAQTASLSRRYGWAKGEMESPDVVCSRL